MKKQTLFGLLGLFLVGIVVAGSASAFGRGFGRDDTVRQAIEDNDFYAWKDAVTSQLTEDNFQQMLENHENIGLGRGGNDNIRQAVEDADYDTYVSAVGEVTDAEPMSEDDFNVLVQIHEAREAGDFDTAKELSEQIDFQGHALGIGKGFGRGKGRGMHGIRQGSCTE